MSDEMKPDVKKVHVDRGLCIGAGTCVVLAPGTFQLDDENIAIVIDEKGNAAEEILMAAESCPTKAVFLYNEQGEQLYP